MKLLDEEMDGVAREQRERLESIDGELEEVKNQLGRVWHFIARSDSVDVAEASDLIVELRERKEKLEIATEEARALLKERRQFLDSADTIAAFAAEMSDFLKTSELTETKAFVGSFVKEVVVKPGRAAIVYSIPTPDDSPMGGADAAEIALNGRVMNSVRHGGPKWMVGGTVFEMWLGVCDPWHSDPYGDFEPLRVGRLENESTDHIQGIAPLYTRSASSRSRPVKWLKSVTLAD